MRVTHLLKWLISLPALALLISGVVFGSAARTVQAQACVGAIDVALVLDHSGSMSDSDIQGVRDFSNGFLGGFQVDALNANVAVIAFGSSASTITGLSGDLSTIQGAIASYGTFDRGTTNMSGGINAGQSALSAGRAGISKVMLLLSDGVPNSVSDALSAASAAKAAGTLIYTIAFSAPPSALATLGSISSIGVAYQAGDVAALQQLVGTIISTTCAPITGAPVAIPCPLPEGSVVGELLGSTRIYWEPGKVSPEGVLEATPDNKTFWVVGMDESGEYYQIFLSCRLYWVPVESMGPAYGDPVWNGTPLPTRVVG